MPVKNLANQILFCCVNPKLLKELCKTEFNPN